MSAGPTPGRHGSCISRWVNKHKIHRRFYLPPEKTGEQLLAQIRHFYNSNDNDVAFHVYRFLDILDNKAIGLLQTSAIQIAAGIVLLTELKTKYLNILVLSSIIAAIVSAYLCLQIIRMSWGFLQEDDLGREIRSLADEVQKRTAIFALARWCSTLGLGLLICPLIIAACLGAFW